MDLRPQGPEIIRTWLWAIRAAELNLRAAGHVRDLVIGEAPERSVTVDLA
jgi:hypothetical protein